MGAKILTVFWIAVFSVSGFAQEAVSFVEPKNHLVKWALEWHRKKLPEPRPLLGSEPMVGAFLEKFQAAIPPGVLFAGGQISVEVLSAQLWILAHPDAHSLTSVPGDTGQMVGIFHIEHLRNGQVLSAIRVETSVKGSFVEPQWSESATQEGIPGYYVLKTLPLTTPVLATESTLKLVAVRDTVNGEETLVDLPSSSLRVAFGPLAKEVYVLGRETISPATSSGVVQFEVFNQKPLSTTFDLIINNGTLKFGRRFSSVWWNRALLDTLDRTPVCYDRLHPNRVQVAEGNDVRIASEELRFRTDGGQWRSARVQEDGTYRIPNVHGRRFEFFLVYRFLADLRSGLGDINRCYQIGSDFEWVPSQPGVSTVELGTFYDAPNGAEGTGWVFNLRPR
ncbi:MAG: hypothetical protein HYR96_05635 [Deltaproteobacteria bacterium]|nr:hypothetical protein [Deltaproteobacteria bacterium]MBI3295772.1 hypothetical protein [Deltaproteobacteria bacterium]